MKKFLSHFKFNAPVTLSFVALCMIALLVDRLTNGWANNNLFVTYRSGLLNPMTYVRAIAYTFGHASWEHFTGNMTFILLLGPLVEEKYGSKNLAEMMIITAVITAILNSILSRNVGILGASGIVFMLIILSSISNVKSGEIPITFVIICIIYLGQQILQCFEQDSISQLAHIVGGLCGGFFGLFMIGHEKEEKRPAAE